MADQTNGSNIKVAKSDDDAVDKKIYVCNYCDKLFFSRRTLGRHQNAHKKEHEAAKERAELQAYFDACAPASYMGASQLEQPLMAHTPNYGSSFDHHTKWQSPAMHAPTNYLSTRYQPYNFSSSRCFGSNGAAQARIDPNSRVFQNYLYDVPVMQASGQLNPAFRGYDQGSSSGEKKYTCEMGKEKDEEELDLTLHL